MFDPVPWFVGGGAQHSPEVARNMLYIATAGAEGITWPGDLKVEALPTPGTSVRLRPGSCTILNRGTGGGQQSYAGRAPSSTDVPVAPTGSAGGRSDLVVARVEDPFNVGEPWQDPANPAVGPYIYGRIISGVPAGTTTLAQAGITDQSAVVLARIDLPPNTATITNSMIVDLRKMARPRQTQETNFNQGMTFSTLTSETFVQWPPYGPGVNVPEWATHVQVRAFLSGIRAVNPVDGEMRLTLRNSGGEPIAYGPIQKYDIDSPVPVGSEEPTGPTGGGGQRFPMILGLYTHIASWRGQRLYQAIEAHKLPNRPDRGDIDVDGNTAIMYDVTFYERPE